MGIILDEIIERFELGEFITDAEFASIKDFLERETFANEKIDKLRALLANAENVRTEKAATQFVDGLIKQVDAVIQDVEL